MSWSAAIHQSALVGTACFALLAFVCAVADSDGMSRSPFEVSTRVYYGTAIFFLLLSIATK